MHSIFPGSPGAVSRAGPGEKGSGGGYDPGMKDAALRIVVAGATGWAGSALSAGIHAAEGMELVGGVSRSRAGETLADALGISGLEAALHATAEEALGARPDVFVEYTKPDVARSNVLAALAEGAHVVIGTSGLDEEDYAAIDAAAREHGRGVLACGNFSLSAVLMMRFSAMAAKWIPNWEVIDYASAGKVDAPSGTARELLHRLAEVGRPVEGVPIDRVQGEKEARGADIGGTRVHSLRLPNFVIGIESIFGMESESLTIRHDAGTSAAPYVGGALLAIRGVTELVGLHRGLDVVMEDG